MPQDPAAPRTSVPPWRIAIAGGGIAGLALALAVTRALGAAVEVVLCDPALKRDPGADRRAYAVAADARRMLAALGVWPRLAGVVQPILDMVVTDSRLQDPVRPVFLTFAGEVEPGEPFAHMVEGGPLSAALLAACEAAGVSLRHTAVRSVAHGPHAIEAELDDGARLRCALVVAADGGRSRLREDAGIGWVAWDYPQSGIVATVAHARDHEGRAVEHFLPAGPFALLPLAPGGSLGHRTSIVWTERDENVAALLALQPEDALLEVERRFGLQLGEIALETPLQAFPLSFGLARRFGAERLALLGDAAHLIHPLAGQGLNLALRDAAALAEAIVDTMRLGLDPGEAGVLDAYERARRFDTFAMAAATDGLNRLFSNDALPVRLMRDLGLGLVDRMGGLKRGFMRQAAGLSDAGPRLTRGEML
jgi:2-octaprenyl-6-methoxyphenol hydroxylase